VIVTRPRRILTCLKFICVALSAFFSLAAFGAQQVSDAKARELAEGVVRASRNLPLSDLLTTRRKEDLEDSLFYEQVNTVGEIVVPAYFYEVTLGGYRIKDQTVNFQVVFDYEPVWCVAVSRSSERTYRLAGFDDAQKEFDRLVRDTGVRIGKNAARNWATFYVEAVYGRATADRIPAYWLALKQRVEAHFYGQYESDKLAKRLFESWWSRFGTKARKLVYEPSVEEVNDVFVVKTEVLHLVERPIPSSERKSVLPDPTLDEWTIRILRDGSCSVLEKRTVLGV